LIIKKYKEINQTNRLAIFDLDGTIIKYSKKQDNWSYLYDTVKNKLKTYTKYRIIIITNQKLLSKSEERYKIWINKIKEIILDLDIPIEIYCSYSDDKYRKPKPTFYNIITGSKKYNAFYCGDAVGRVGDFSDTDLKFALNCNIKCYTPEIIFLGFDNKNKSIKYPILPTKTLHSFKYNNTSNKQLILMIGFPASGKSTVAKKIASTNNNYIIINQDTMKTKKKCLDETLKNIKLNYNIIIDNTNVTKDIRKEYIDIAKKYNYKVIYVVMLTSKEISLHNNYYRNYKTGRELIPSLVYNIINKKYQKPEKEENIDEIIEVEPMRPISLDYFLYYY